MYYSKGVGAGIEVNSSVRFLSAHLSLSVLQVMGHTAGESCKTPLFPLLNVTVHTHLFRRHWKGVR